MSHHLKFFSTHPPFRVNSYSKLDLIRKELEAIIKYESNAGMWEYVPYLISAAEEAIDVLSGFLDYDPTPEDGGGEPPMTMAEMHTAAWKEHVAMHS